MVRTNRYQILKGLVREFGELRQRNLQNDRHLWERRAASNRKAQVRRKVHFYNSLPLCRRRVSR